MALRSNFTDLFLADALPVLKEVVMEEYEKLPDNIPQCFRMLTMDGWGEQTTTIAGLKPVISANEGENVTFDDPIQGFERTYIPVEYKLATSFSQTLIEDNKLGLVEETYRSLGMAMYQTRQVTAFNIFNDGFADTGPDGVSLFNTAHVLIGGGTYANRPATDISLSIAGLREMEVDLMRQVNHRNINIALMPRKILVPPELRQSGRELLGSPDKPDTANRAINAYYEEKYMLVVTPYLTSTTAWFAMTEPGQHQLRFYDRVTPEVESWQDKPSGDVNTKIRARFIVSYSDYIGTWGTTG